MTAHYQSLHCPRCGSKLQGNLHWIGGATEPVRDSFECDRCGTCFTVKRFAPMTAKLVYVASIGRSTNELSFALSRLIQWFTECEGPGEIVFTRTSPTQPQPPTETPS